MRKIICAIAASAVLGCSGDGSSTGPSTTGTTVTVGNNSFTPATLSVPLNGSVTWTWNSAGVEHNVTFQSGTSSATQGAGSFARNFPTAGTYSYVCTIHAALGMSGVVNVGGGGGGGGGY